VILSEGQILRDFRVLKLLGEGGMGEVWLAEDVNIERKVALKALYRQYSVDQELVERFRQEARIQSTLSHPNIVTLHSFFSHDGSYFIVMEYAPGISLRELIGKTGPIPFPRTLNIVSQILSALEYTHRKGIIHRDIKPSNIMIDTENGDEVKIMDFGIAKAMEDLSHTRTGTQMGTIWYMSPEQIHDVKNIDHRSDLFSLGIVLYEMLTGVKPYDISSESSFKIQSQIVYDPLPDPLLTYPHIPLWIVNLLRKLCEKDPAKRYQQASQALWDIQRMEVAPPVQEAPLKIAPEPSPASEPKSRSLWWILIPFGMIALLMLLTVLRQPKPETEPVFDKAKYEEKLPVYEEEAEPEVNPDSIQPASDPVAADSTAG